jgi:hypothetical protein
VYRQGAKIIFSVYGSHTTDAAIQATQYISTLMADISGPVEFVADLRNVTGFAKDARKYWQDAFESSRHRIQVITLVRGTALARMAASALGVYARIKVRSVETLEEALSADIAPCDEKRGARLSTTGFDDSRTDPRPG